MFLNVELEPAELAKRNFSRLLRNVAKAKVGETVARLPTGLLNLVDRLAPLRAEDLN